VRCCFWPVCSRRHLDESANYHQTFGWSESCSSADFDFDCFSALLSRVLHLIIVSTLISRAKLRTLRVVRACVPARLTLKLPFVVRQFPSFALNANFLVQRSLEIGECMTLQLIVQWSNQSFQETLLALIISIYLFRCIA
jgi:hypothetical protein